jgi:hypothetical protein
MTVAVMVPEKSLVFSVAPLPSKVLADSPSADARAKAPGLMPGSALMEAETLPVLPMELLLVCAGAHALDDRHVEQVAHHARAVVLEQRPVLRGLEIEPLTGAGAGHGVGQAGAARPSPRAVACSVRQPEQGGGGAQRRGKGEQARHAWSDLPELLQHLVAGLDCLGVHLVGALCGDHRHAAPPPR